MSMDTLWPPAAQEVARLEGWSLFDCFDYGHAPVELEIIDDADEDATQLGDDEEAWRLVITKASHGGSAPHIGALAFLAFHSIEELIGIVNYLMTGQYRAPVQEEPTE